MKRITKGYYRTIINNHPFHFVHGSDGWFVMTPFRGLSDELSDALDSMKSSYETKRELVDSFMSSINQ
jgi:hypothetical protein